MEAFTEALTCLYEPRGPRRQPSYHGDIAPENLVWYQPPGMDRGNYVLVDLGHGHQDDTKGTRPLPGRYPTPESLGLVDDSHLNVHAIYGDIHQAGQVIVYALTGLRPSAPSRQATEESMRQIPALIPSGLPRELSELLHDMVTFDPWERVRRLPMSELADRMHAVRASLHGSQGRPQPVAPVARREVVCRHALVSDRLLRLRCFTHEPGDDSAEVELVDWGTVAQPRQTGTVPSPLRQVGAFVDADLVAGSDAVAAAFLVAGSVRVFTQRGRDIRSGQWSQHDFALPPNVNPAYVRLCWTTSTRLLVVVGGPNDPLLRCDLSYDGSSLRQLGEWLVDHAPAESVALSRLYEGGYEVVALVAGRLRVLRVLPDGEAAWDSIDALPAGEARSAAAYRQEIHDGFGWMVVAVDAANDLWARVMRIDMGAAAARWEDWRRVGSVPVEPTDFRFIESGGVPSVVATSADQTKIMITPQRL
ncbi:MAG: hypothetical protein QM621_04110 [Aeromicrobium sp.]|uniref:hypothetical protein n=1 Tax=Aeromicrobium sp. TaxID=1871063 RepID=UPI0039E4550F